MFQNNITMIQIYNKSLKDRIKNSRLLKCDIDNMFEEYLESFLKEFGIKFLTDIYELNDGYFVEDIIENYNRKDDMIKYFHNYWDNAIKIINNTKIV